MVFGDLCQRISGMSNFDSQLTWFVTLTYGQAIPINCYNMTLDDYLTSSLLNPWWKCQASGLCIASPLGTHFTVQVPNRSRGQDLSNRRKTPPISHIRAQHRTSSLQNNRWQIGAGMTIAPQIWQSCGVMRFFSIACWNSVEMIIMAC